MEIKKSKVLIQFLQICRRSGVVLFFVYAGRLRGYTATTSFFNFGNQSCNFVKTDNFQSITPKLNFTSQLSFERCLAFFPSQVATLSNEKKLAAVNTNNQREHPRNTKTRRVNEDYITQT